MTHVYFVAFHVVDDQHKDGFTNAEIGVSRPLESLEDIIQIQDRIAAETDNIFSCRVIDFQLLKIIENDDDAG